METFDKIYNRKAYNCIKWNKNPYNHKDFIPLGIADMDFATPNFVIEAMKKRLEHPILGYFRPDNRFYNAIFKWQMEQYGVKDLNEEDIIVQTSVLGGLASAIQILTEPGDKIMVQAPGYFNFTKVIDGLGRILVPNRLIWYKGQYNIDFEEMEQQIKSNKVKVFLLCSPHNPTGRVWSKRELSYLAQICERNNVIVVADEIWADIVYDGNVHIPFHTISDWSREHTISLYAPTKTFNIAGITIGFGVIKNVELREKFIRECCRSHYNLPNLLSVEAMISAYENGAEWKDELCRYLRENTALIVDFFHEHYPQIQVAVPQGTYLIWLDFSKTGLSSDILLDKFGNAGLYFNDGRTCIAWGDACLRMNVALPRITLRNAMKRIETVMQGSLENDR